MHEMLLSRRAVNFFSISRYVIMASRAESLMRVVCFAGSVFYGMWTVIGVRSFGLIFVTMFCG